MENQNGTLAVLSMPWAGISHDAGKAWARAVSICIERERCERLIKVYR